MDGAVAPVRRPGRLGGDRPRGGFVDPVAIAIGRSEARQAGSGPRVEGDAESARDHPRP